METYAIKGGNSGRERLRVLSHVRQGATLGLLDKIGVRPGMSCLDVGCGGGEVSRELARRVGASGRVVALDMDSAQLEIVRAETIAQKLLNIDYRVADAGTPPSNLGRFDVVYTRFLLCHLKSGSSPRATTRPARLSTAALGPRSIGMKKTSRCAAGYQQRQSREDPSAGENTGHGSRAVRGTGVEGLAQLADQGIP
jgi:SAM-dependent methyltransferase